MAAPCNWMINTDCCPEWVTFTPLQQTNATNWATQILHALSGRRFGVCDVTVRPCMRCVAQTYRTYGVWQDSGSSAAVGPTWIPYIGVDGQWRNCGCSSSSCCDCEPSCQVWLPGPVASVSQVLVNNVVVPAANYRVDVANDGNFWLVGENGQCWPETQDFDEPASGAVNTFVVMYGRGTVLPEAGQIAAGRLACEYAKMCAGQPCALTPNATTITRDGVTYQILSTDDVIRANQTGVFDVDLWIRAVNPHGLSQRPRVWSPDSDTPRMTVVA